MSELTTEQEAALAKFKHELHLPEGGFHKLILELCREFNLPFQTVRKSIKQSQKQIEKAIKAKDWREGAVEATKADWLSIIHSKLLEHSNGAISVSERIECNSNFKRLKSEVESINSDIRDSLIAETYFEEIYTPLKEMLYTSKLYWTLREEFIEMDSERIEKFSEYSDYYDAMVKLKDIQK